MPLPFRSSSLFCSVLALVALLSLGCSNEKPCTDCAVISGTYALTFNGELSTVGSCDDAIPVLDEGSLVIRGSGSKLTGSFLKFTGLSGTLYQSNAVSLLGSHSLDDGSETLSLSLNYADKTDASPATLTGTATQTDTTGVSSAPTSCTQRVDVVATQS